VRFNHFCFSVFVFGVLMLGALAVFRMFVHDVLGIA
jgi:hypothetical protein